MLFVIFYILFCKVANFIFKFPLFVSFTSKKQHNTEKNLQCINWQLCLEAWSSQNQGNLAKKDQYLQNVPLKILKTVILETNIKCLDRKFDTQINGRYAEFN